MRHLKHSNSLGRTKEHRAALMANLAAALLTHGKIQTTLAKAKALRPFVEKIITFAKRAEGASPERALHLRRLAIARVRDNDAVAKLFKERASEFTARNGGYTRIYKLGTRVGDGAEMAVIQLIAAADEGYPKKGRKTTKKAAMVEKPAAAATAEVEAPAEKASAAEAAEPVVEATGTESPPETAEPAAEEKKD